MINLFGAGHLEIGGVGGVWLSVIFEKQGMCLWAWTHRVLTCLGWTRFWMGWAGLRGDAISGLWGKLWGKMNKGPVGPLFT